MGQWNTGFIGVFSFSTNLLHKLNALGNRAKLLRIKGDKLRLRPPRIRRINARNAERCGRKLSRRKAERNWKMSHSSFMRLVISGNNIVIVLWMDFISCVPTNPPPQVLNLMGLHFSWTD